jgi:hypothetical protein
MPELLGIKAMKEATQTALELTSAGDIFADDEDGTNSTDEYFMQRGIDPEAVKEVAGSGGTQAAAILGALGAPPFAVGTVTLTAGIALGLELAAIRDAQIDEI